MNKRIMVVGLLLIVAILMSGCVDESSIVVSYNGTENCIDNNTINTNIVREDKRLTVTGRVVEITFKAQGEDIIVFEDNYVIGTYPAEEHIWKMGEIHQIKMIKFLGEYQITSVEIITEVNDK